MATKDISLPSRRDKLYQFLHRLRGSRSAMIGIGLLVPIITITVLAPHLPLPDPRATDPTNPFASPGLEYWMGTDNYGRDLFVRTLLGGRMSLLFGVGSTALGLALGVPIGIASGYYGGKVDEVLMRSMDLLLAFPSLLLALLILAVLGGNVFNAILAVGIIFTPRIARIVRSSTLSVKNETFVTASRARGESDIYIMSREILPNIMAPIIVEGSIRVGFGILIGTSLSFLGLGAQPPTPDWGYMIAQSRNYLFQSPWLMIWPSTLLALTVLGFNMLGDGLRDVVQTEVEEQ